MCLHKTVINEELTPLKNGRVEKSCPTLSATILWYKFSGNSFPMICFPGMAVPLYRLHSMNRTFMTLPINSSGTCHYKEVWHFHTWVNSSSSRKNSWIARAFAWEFLRSVKRYKPGQKLNRLGKCCSLHSKNNFLVGGWQFFVSDVISGGILGHLDPLHLFLGPNH